MTMTTARADSLTAANGFAMHSRVHRPASRTRRSGVDVVVLPWVRLGEGCPVPREP